MGQIKHILDVFSKYQDLYINSKISCNISPHTINSAKVTLERFYNYIADEVAENPKLKINDINKYFLNNYLNSLNLSENSKKLHLTIIKTFLTFIADDDIKKYGSIKLNLSGIKLKTTQTEKESFTQHEQQRLLAYLKILDNKNSFLAQRNSLIIKLLLFTGLRISELINIKHQHLSEVNDENSGCVFAILVRGKGNKERYTYIKYDKIIDNLEFIKTAYPNNEYLFTTTQGNQCNRSMLFIVIRHVLEKAKIFNKSGLHIFRHTFARNLVNKNINLATIKELLGHSNITITAQFYAKSNEKAKQKALLS